MIERIMETPVGEFVYGVDVGSLEVAVIRFLKENGLTLCTAESCTGGLIAKRLTDVSGASEVFLGGCVTYANSAKEGLIGVSHESLEKFGAVSEQVALEMARGVRKAVGADIAVSTTGIAGPDGGTPEKPVGTVWIAVNFKGEVISLLLQLENKGRDAKVLGLDMQKLVRASEGFSGAEIEEVVNEALFNAYANGQKDLEMKNLLDCIDATSPLSRTMAETIANLRKWAEQRARLASSEKPEEVKELGEEVPRLQQEYSNPFISKKSK
jgi:PncC family amidohydrolase